MARLFFDSFRLLFIPGSLARTLTEPFCDGTHSKIGFQAAAQAVPGSAEKS